MRKRIEYPPGTKFFDWTATGKRNARRMECVCACGKVAWPAISNLTTGASKSCGCAQPRQRKEQAEAKKKAKQAAAFVGPPNLRRRFMQKVDTAGSDGCWIWKSTLSDGRAQFRVNSKYRPAARVSYELFVGPIPEGMLACHKCDNPACVNPHHIFPGTHRDNVMDSISKGRFKHLVNLSKIKGNTHHGASY